MGCISSTSVSRYEIYVFENLCVCIFVYSSSLYDKIYERKVMPKIIISYRCDDSRVRCQQVNDVSSCSRNNEYDVEDNEYYLIMYLRKKREQRQMMLMTPSPWEQIAKLAIS